MYFPCDLPSCQARTSVAFVLFRDMLGSLENLLLGSFAIVCLCSCLAFGSGGAFQITSGFPQESRSQFISVAF